MCIRHVTLMYMQPGYFVRQIRWQKGGTGKDRRALCNLVWSGGCEAAMSQSVEFEPYECCLCAGVMALIQGALCVLMFMARFRARLVVGRALSSPCCRQGFELACFGLMSNLCYGRRHPPRTSVAGRRDGKEQPKGEGVRGGLHIGGDPHPPLVPDRNVRVGLLPPTVLAIENCVCSRNRRIVSSLRCGGPLLPESFRCRLEVVPRRAGAPRRDHQSVRGSGRAPFSVQHPVCTEGIRKVNPGIPRCIAFHRGTPG
jgi:hypothetical protein